jgi:hypothetical protein
VAFSAGGDDGRKTPEHPARATNNRSLDGEIVAPPALASARVREHIGPPFFAAGLLRVRPGTVLDGITRL